MAGSPSVLAIDQGTTGSTALVISRDCRVLGRAYSEFEQHFPKPGWVEHDAEEIWRVTCSVARRAVAEAADADVRSIGITNQRETVVLWDRETLEPVHRAIVWQDRRTASICGELREGGHLPTVRKRTGLMLDPYFSGTKLTWLFREYPALRARAEAGELAAGTIDTWLIARLTAGEVHATDPTNASRTLLFDLETAAWDPALAALFEVPAGLLPEIRPSSGDFGVARGDSIGLEVPIGGVAGDQQAALFGQGCWEAGQAKNTYGTGAFLLLNTGSEIVRSSHGLLTTAACSATGGLAYALEGSVFIAGAAVQWLRDGLGLLESAGESGAMAAELDGNDGVYFVPALVGLGAPWWEPDARGALFGLTRGTGRAHLVRAALEAMAYGTADVLEAMEADSGVRASDLRVDGGGATNDFTMQFQSDLLGIPVRRPDMVETTAFGAAGLAGLSAGVWSTSEDLGTAGGARVFEPAPDSGGRHELRTGWRRAVDSVLHWTRNAPEGT